MSDGLPTDDSLQLGGGSILSSGSTTFLAGAGPEREPSVFFSADVDYSLVHNKCTESMRVKGAKINSGGKIAGSNSFGVLGASQGGVRDDDLSLGETGSLGTVSDPGQSQIGKGKTATYFRKFWASLNFSRKNLMHDKKVKSVLTQYKPSTNSVITDY